MTDRPTGEQLYQELEAEAARRCISLASLATSLWPSAPSWRLEQLRIAKTPKDRTIAQIRGLIAGEIEGVELGPSFKISRDVRRELGIAPSRREINENRLLGSTITNKRIIEERMQICRLAHDRRLPGETLQAAIIRLERELAA